MNITKESALVAFVFYHGIPIAYGTSEIINYICLTSLALCIIALFILIHRASAFNFMGKFSISLLSINMVLEVMRGFIPATLHPAIIYTSLVIGFIGWALYIAQVIKTKTLY